MTLAIAAFAGERERRSMSELGEGGKWEV